MFNQNEEQIKQSMFEQEMNMNREQNALGFANVSDAEAVQEASIDIKKAELTRWQQDLQEEIEFQIRLLKNQFLNDKGEWEFLTYTKGERDEDNNEIYYKMKPKINDIGINYFRSQTLPLISRNLIMSNYDEDRLLILLRSTVVDFIGHINYNREFYSIEKGDMTHIVRVFKSTITPSFYRCLKAGERQAGTTIRKEIGATTYTEQPMQKQQSGGFFLRGN